MGMIVKLYVSCRKVFWVLMKRSITPPFLLILLKDNNRLYREYNILEGKKLPEIALTLLLFVLGNKASFIRWKVSCFDIF
jgi:hypothetical protein